MSPTYYTLALVALFAMFQQGLSLKCYQCNTVQHDDGSCATGALDDKHLVECPSVNQTMCRKIEQEINIDGEDTTRITRECATSKSAAMGECLERTGTYRFKSWYCECKDAGCNTASSTPVSLFVSTVFISSAYLLKKLM